MRPVHVSLVPRSQYGISTHTEDEDECSDCQTVSRDKPTELRWFGDVERFANDVDDHQALRKSGL